MCKAAVILLYLQYLLSAIGAKILQTQGVVLKFCPQLFTHVLQGSCWSRACRIAAKDYDANYSRHKSPKDLLESSRKQKNFLSQRGVNISKLSHVECSGIILTVWTEPGSECCKNSWKVCMIVT